MKMVAFVSLVLVLLVSSLIMAGGLRWRARTASIRSALVPAAGAGSRVDLSVLDGAPAPVRRYLELALVDGQPRIERAHFRHRGRFDMGRETPKWRPFTSDQVVVLDPVGFDWNGRVSLLPGLAARVHDAYVGGRGRLEASLGGLISVARLGDSATPEAVRRALDECELLRYLAESVWFPTALIPGDQLRWRAVGERAAVARLRDGETEVELEFRFGDDGFVESVHSEGRGRYVDGEMVPTPWEGRFWNVQERGGMRIPIEGEVAWVLPEGRRAYWRGRIEEIEYGFGG